MFWVSFWDYGWKGLSSRLAEVDPFIDEKIIWAEDLPSDEEDMKQDESLSPLALLYRLNTTIHESHVIHKRRKQSTEGKGKTIVGDTECWTRVKLIGEGGQGTIYLETSETTPKVRAVKKIHQQSMRIKGLDIKRELHALIAVRDVSEMLLPSRN